MSVTRPGWPSCWSMGCCGAASCPGGHPRAAGPDPLPQAADPGPHRRGPAGPKTLEDAGIKLDSVAADVLGVSGRAMLAALVGGERDPQVLAELAKGRLRAKLPQLRQALRGRFRAHHALLIRLALAHLDQLERSIAELDAQVDQVIAPFAQARDRLDTITGVGKRG